MKKKVRKLNFEPESFQDLVFFSFFTVANAVEFAKKNKFPCMIWVKSISQPITTIHVKNKAYA